MIKGRKTTFEERVETYSIVLQMTTIMRRHLKNIRGLISRHGIMPV